MCNTTVLLPMGFLSPEQRTERMRSIRSRNTKPEILVRRVVHAMGYRYRLHRRDLPGTPDLAFPARRKAIYVHGCFWHQHPDPGCRLARRPKRNLEYWSPKFRRNVERDSENFAALASLGWQALVVWECETRDLDALASRLRAFLE